MFNNFGRRFKSGFVFTILFGLAYSIVTLLAKLLNQEPNFIFEALYAVLLLGFIIGWLVDFFEIDSDGAR